MKLQIPFNSPVNNMDLQPHFSASFSPLDAAATANASSRCDTIGTSAKNACATSLQADTKKMSASN